MIDVTYILSVNYSGSHLLAQLLGAHSRCASIGELRNYAKFTRTDNDRTTTSDFAHNPIFSGLDSVPESEWYPLIHSRVIAEYPSVTMLIDNSKKPEWAARFERNQRIRPHYVHLIRDPRALLRRWRNDYDTRRQLRRQRRKLVFRSPSKLGVALFGSDHEVLVLKWLLANRRITRFMRASGQPLRVLTYHDLATRTVEELTPVMSDLGLEFEERQLSFGMGKSFGTHKTEYAALTECSEIRMDLRWKNDLPMEVQRTVVGIDEVIRYLGELGLAFCEDGLTRHGDFTSHRVAGA